MKNILVLLSIFMMTCCGQIAQNIEGAIITPQSNSLESEVSKDGWLVCNIFGDGVFRKVAFMSSGNASYLVIRKVDSEENEFVVGPKSQISTDIIEPTLADLNNDRVPDVIWPTEQRISILTINGGNVLYFLDETQVSSLNIEGDKIWMARVVEPTCGLVEIPWCVALDKLLPEPFQFGVRIPKSESSNSLAKLWERFFTSSPPSVYEVTRYAKRQNTDCIRAFVCLVLLENNLDAKSWLEEQGLSGNQLEQTILTFRAELALWHNKLDEAQQLVQEAKKLDLSTGNNLLEDVISHLP